jgi:hypothetical protein
MITTNGTAAYDGAARGDRLATAVRAAARRGARRGPRALLVLGTILQPVGGALILLGWAGAANSTDVWEQIPYLISGGLLGLGMVIAGGFCYFGYWQTESVGAQRRQAATEERVLAVLERIEGLLESSAAASSASTGPSRARPSGKAAS